MKQTLTKSASALAFLCSLLLMSAQGCRNDKMETCDSAAGHVGSLIESEARLSQDPKRLEEALVHLPALVNALKGKCDEAPWTNAIKRCILEAESAEALEACDPTLPPAPS